MKRRKVLLIGVGSVGIKAIDKLVSNGVSSSTIKIQDNEDTKPDELSYKYILDDQESPEQLRQFFTRKIENLKIDKDDMVVVISDLGIKITTAISTMLSVCAKSRIDITVMGVFPKQNSKEYDEAVFDSKYIQGHNRCKCFMGFSVEDVYKELEASSDATSIDSTIEAIYNVTDTMINGKMTGYYRASDMKVSYSLPQILGLHISTSNILFGTGKDSKTAFKEAVGEFNITDCNAVAFNVSGDPYAIEDSIERAVNFCGVDRLWLTHRLADAETVQVTMMVA
jgi:hypothetical protein